MPRLYWIFWLRIKSSLRHISDGIRFTRNLLVIHHLRNWSAGEHSEITQNPNGFSLRATPKPDDDKTRTHSPLTMAPEYRGFVKSTFSILRPQKSGHNLVTMTRNSLCRNASLGFDSPHLHQFNSLLYNSISDGRGCDTPTPDFASLYSQITPNNVRPLWTRFGHSG
jgi:hypothetical protein